MRTGTTRVHEIVELLKLRPHPERGHFVESYRSDVGVEAPTQTSPRSAATAIHFLVTAEQPTTHLHRLASDEIFHLYEGGPLDIVRLFADGSADIARLGLNLAAGERPQIVVRRGTWFGTELVPGSTYCWMGCTVAPGFDFEDFELSDDGALAARYPAMADRIQRLARGR
jgi:predicted cupin superfamily sugar epimerase